MPASVAALRLTPQATPAAPSEGTLLYTKASGGVWYRDAGGAETLLEAGTATAPHASTHASGGTDAITVAQSQVTNLTTDLAARALAARTISAGTGLTGGGDLTANRTLTVAYGTAAGTAAEGNDTRLSNARTPTAHGSSHRPGGSDVLPAGPVWRVRQTTAQAAPTANTWTNVTFQTEDEDSHFAYSSSGFQVPSGWGGVYTITCGICVNTGRTNGHPVFLRIVINGVPVGGRSNGVAQTATTDVTEVTLAHTTRAAASDVFRVEMFQRTSVAGLTATGEAVSFFEGAWLRP